MLRLLPFSWLLFPASWAQTTPAPSLDAGQKIYATHCIACHGPDAEGTDQGPKLTNNRRVRSRTIDQMRTFLKQGRPAAGMPAFPLPGAELTALSTFVHSLNIPASENPIDGSAAAGETFFFGKGQCANCHMVKGRGRAIGPDLSDLARQMTLGDLRQVLRNPGSRITPGYERVTVTLSNGGTLHGFARGRTNFDLQLQDLEGRFHMLQAPQIVNVVDQSGSLMKPLDATAEETRNLLAYLTRLTGPKEGPISPTQPGPSEITFERMKNPHPGDWLTYNGTLDGNRYSKLTHINTANIAKLGVKWVYPVEHYGVETTPLVADGVMYLTGPNQAIALDAATGRLIWRYSRPRTPGLIGDASLGTNRGLAILGDKVFLSTDNAHLLALNRITGALVWDVYMPDEPMHYGSTVAPLIVRDTVIAGVSGGDRGMRGFLVCYKADTGERIWRRWTVPLKGDKARETWGAREPVDGGGATWLTGAYDVSTDTLYWPTGNPFPDSDDKERPGDNLYTNCILAIQPQTGEIKWHYQFTPHDVHDWDATEPPVLVDAEWRGQPRKLLLHADRNAFFYILDRTTGELLLTRQFARQTWTAGIGADGRPLPPPEKDEGLDCPGSAANWNSAAYSPLTGLFYFLAQEECRSKGKPAPPTMRFVRALDIATGNLAWEIPLLGVAIQKTWPGILATQGGLVFYGDPNGTFAAADAGTGKTLWHFPANVYMKASPMTYTVNGKQYVATAAGPNILAFSLPE